MKLYFVVFAVFLAFAVDVNGDPLDEDFGYVDVRPGAHMFWVVYHTELPGDWTEHPLIMWMQGGPGSSGVGFGNFKELGPYDMDGNLREGRWTQKGNLLFVDSPVGTGYSYVDDFDELCTDNIQIADDLLTMLKSVFSDYPEMQRMPFFIFAESYGGKMTADFAVALDEAIKNREITCDFQGIALGDSWISPMDSVNTWGPFLYSMGLVNKDGQAAIDEAAAKTQAAVDQEQWVQATMEWDNTEIVIENETDGVDFYNVLAPDSSPYAMTASARSSLKKYSFMRPAIRNLFLRHAMPLSNEARESLTDFMNGPQKNLWNIPDNVVWGSQAGYVFNHLAGDFMKPVVTSVSDLLTNSDIHVSIYTGDLDLVCDTPGTSKWIDNMDYPQKDGFERAMRRAIKISNYPNNAAYVQRFERFSLFTLLRSGHMVPIDVPDMTLKMIDMIIRYSSEAAVTRDKHQEPKNKVSIVRSKLEDAKMTQAEKPQKKERVKQIVEQKKEQMKEKKEQVPKVVVKKEHSKPTNYEKVEIDKDLSKMLKQKVSQNTEHIHAAKLQKLSDKVEDKKQKKEQVNEKKKKEPKKEQVPKVVVKKEHSKPTNYEKVEINEDVRKMLKEKVFQNTQNIHAEKLQKISKKMEDKKPVEDAKKPVEDAKKPVEDAKIRKIKDQVAKIVAGQPTPL